MRLLLLSATVSLLAISMAEAGDAGCTPTQLVVKLARTDIPVIAGFPTQLSVSVSDDCGTPVTTGSVVVAFSNGDPPLRATSLGDGFWVATYLNSGAGPDLQVQVRATSGLLTGAAVANFKTQRPATLAVSTPDIPPVEAGGLIATTSVTVTSDPPGQPFSVSTILGGVLDTEIIVVPKSGVTPATLQLQVAPDLTRNPNAIYQGLLVLNTPSNSILGLPFPVIVTAPSTPVLSVPSAPLVFAYVGDRAARSRSITIANPSGIALHYRSFPTTVSGGNWLSVSPSEGDTTVRQPATLTVKADPSGLAPGTYSGSVVVADPAGLMKQVPVTMTITHGKPAILLSQIGLTFSAVQSGRTEPAQGVRVINAGRGTLNWSATARTRGAAAGWLTVAPASGQSVTGDDGVSLGSDLSVIANGSGLAPGQYYGLVEVTADGADNGPQYITVILRVAPNDGRPVYFVRPSGLVFSGVSGGAAPAVHALSVYDLSGGAVTFESSAGFLNPGDNNWFSYLPANYPAPAFSPELDGGISMKVSARPAGLDPGAHRGLITIQFPDSTTRVVSVLLQVAPPPAPPSKNRTVDSAVCVPTRIDMQYASAAGIRAATGWPSAILVRAVDDCRNPLTSGDLEVSFSNGDVPLRLDHVQGDTWAGTWIPGRFGGSATKLDFHATDSTRGLDSRTTFPVVIPTDGQDSPAVSAVVEPIRYQAGVPLAPGSLISLLGTRFSDSDGLTGNAPYPIFLGDTSLLVKGINVPLLAVGGASLTGVLPFELPVNTTVQLVVSRGVTYSVPVPVTIAIAQPAILSGADSQARVFHASRPDVQVSAADPARPGEAILIECAGLGRVTAAPDNGAAPADVTATVNTVHVRIGGYDAPVDASGLKVGTVGVYQILAHVPSPIPADAATGLQISVEERVSDAVTIAVGEPL